MQLLRFTWFLIFAVNFCAAQEVNKNIRYADYLRSASGAPKRITEDGKTSIFAIKLQYIDGQLVQPAEFSKNSTPEFKAFIESHYPDLDTLPWYKFIPAVKNLNHFKIWWLHSYALDDANSRIFPFSSDEFDKNLRDAFEIVEGEKEVTFIAPPYSLRMIVDRNPPVYTESDSALLKQFHR